MGEMADEARMESLLKDLGQLEWEAKEALRQKMEKRFTTVVEGFQEEGKKDFVWHTKDGRDIPVSNMSTDHLFWTVRMIWNHTAPAHLRLTPYNKYQLNFSAEYLKRAVKAMLKELRGRELTVDQEITLEWMVEVSHNHGRR